MVISAIIYKEVQLESLSILQSLIIHYSMKRIGFISLYMTILLLHSCKQPKEPVTTEHQYLEEITIQQLQTGYQQGTFTIEKVVGDYLKRIADIDKAGPGLNSIIHINSKAIEVAKQLDQELKDGKSRGPLHGIPVILKDNINTQDMPTTAGATVLRDVIQWLEWYVGADKKSLCARSKSLWFQFRVWCISISKSLCYCYRNRN
jgi:hypothetical protein